MSNSILALLLGYLIDLFLGDPHWLWHPVTGIGKLIAYVEKWLRRRIEAKAKTDADRQRRERKSGVWLVLIVCLVSVLVPVLLLGIAYRVHPYCGLILESILCWQMLAGKSLKTESRKVWKCLQAGDTEGARRAVSMIVGRDTEALEEKGIIKACVETVAENTTDGVIAPICYMALFGAAGGYLYKAVNTMDSMVGYRNERYRNLGRAAAKLDDIVNFIPARISACYLMAAAFLLGLDGKNAVHIFKRDRFCHASPNSAQTESVCAGALHVQLAGDASYSGKLCQKPYIGDADREIETEDITRTNRMMDTAVFLAILTAAGFLWGTGGW